MDTNEKNQGEINNPIKDNRIVCDFSFATRFLSFAKSVVVNDACSYDEKESMIHYAKDLLQYQCRTAKDITEIDYLKRVGVYEGNIKPYLTTHDGVELFEGTQILVFSCMKTPNRTDQVLHFKFRNENDVKTRSVNRLFFVDKKKCEEYMEFNSPNISKSDLQKVGMLEDFKGKTGA